MTNPRMKTLDNSLEGRLRAAELYDEFCALIFGQGERYEDLLERLEEWGISSSLGALSRFKDSNLSPWTMERARRTHAAMLVDEGVDLDEAQRKMVAERIFNLAASPNLNDKNLLKLRDQEIKMAVLENDRKKLELAERRIEVLESKIDETKNDLSNGTLTEEERAARMRARFGVAN